MAIVAAEAEDTIIIEVMVTGIQAGDQDMDKEEATEVIIETIMVGEEPTIITSQTR